MLSMNKKYLSICCSLGLILTAAIWGFAFVIVKDSLDYIGPVWMVAFRFTIATICLAIIYNKKLKLLNKSYFINGGILGLFLFMAYLTQTIGCDYTTAGKNAFLTTIYVILIPLISWPLYKKWPGLLVFVSAILCVTGIGLLSLGQGDGEGMNIGDILTLICGLFYALHIIFVEKFNRKQDALLLTVLQFAYAALFGWLVAPFYDGAFPLEQVKNFKVIESMMYLGIFSTMIAFSLQNICLKFVPSALASLFLSLESVFGVFFSVLLLGEILTVRMWIGCILIFAAILLSEVIPKIFMRKS